eukprot:scaffold13283_cov82-Cyclotella_meneghiniana.AAC.2
MDRKRRLRGKKRKPKPLYHLTAKQQLLQTFHSLVRNDSVKHEVISYITLFRVALYWLFSESVASRTLARSIGSKAVKGLTSFMIFRFIYNMARYEVAAALIHL